MSGPLPTPDAATGRQRLLPGLRLVRHYPIGWLRHDLAAGLVLATLLVPAGVAYAAASGLGGIHGLYATIAALLAYALFGPSRIMVLGPDSSLAALILAVVVPIAAGDPARAATLAAAMAVVSGLLCLAAGLARLGFITELLSKPIRYGYMNGIALALIFSQLPRMLGVEVHGSGPFAPLLALSHGVRDAAVHGPTLGIGLLALALVLGPKRWPRWPAMLAAIVVATLAVPMIAPHGGVALLGALPTGLPVPTLPLIALSDLIAVLGGAAAIALVSFADTAVLSRTLAQRDGHAVDANQEMVALGAANLAAGLLQGMPVSSSSSRTPVALAAGAKSQLTGVVGALAVAALLFGAPRLLEQVPLAALAAVVIAAAIGLIEWRDLRRIRRIQAWEFWLSIACTAGVLLLGAIEGIVLAVLIAVTEFLWDGWRPHHAVLGRVPGIDGYHDIQRHPEAARIPGLVLLRWDAPLFFANAEWFERVVRDTLAASPAPVRWLVVTAEPMTSIDVTAADMLRELDQSLQAKGIELCFAEMKGPVKDKLARFGLFSHFGQQTFFATIDDAVRAYRAALPEEGEDRRG